MAQSESILSQNVGLIDGIDVSVRVAEAFLHNDKMQFSLELSHHLEGHPNRQLIPKRKTVIIPDADYQNLMTAIMGVPEVAAYLQTMVAVFVQEVYPQTTKEND